MRWLRDFFVEYLVIAVTLAAVAKFQSPPVFALAVGVLGTRQLAVAVLGHDAIHGHAGCIGKALSRLCFWPLGWGVHAFCGQHFAHHRWPGIPALDPETPLRRMDAGARRFGRWIIPMDLCGYSIPQMVVWFRIVRPRAMEDALGPLLFLGAFIALAPPRCVAVWFTSMLVLATVSRQRAYTDHDGPLALRMRKPALWRRLLYLPHGTWLHWEHHRWPALPVSEQAAKGLS